MLRFETNISVEKVIGLGQGIFAGTNDKFTPGLPLLNDSSVGDSHAFLDSFGSIVVCELQRLTTKFTNKFLQESIVHVPFMQQQSYSVVTYYSIL